MKAITICQPYASLILLPESDPRHKRVENRTWECWRSLIGQRIAIHSGASRKWLETWPGQMPVPMPFGSVLGTAVIAASLLIDDIRSGRHTVRFPWLLEHQHAVGPVCWVLENIRPLSVPIPCSGRQGLWDLPWNLAETLR